MRKDDKESSPKERLKVKLKDDKESSNKERLNVKLKGKLNE